MFLFLYYQMIISAFGLSHQERNITLSLFKHFDAQHFILFSNVPNKLSAFDDFKFFSKRNKLGMVLSPKQAVEYSYDNYFQYLDRCKTPISNRGRDYFPGLWRKALLIFEQPDWNFVKNTLDGGGSGVISHLSYCYKWIVFIKQSEAEIIKSLEKIQMPVPLKMDFLIINQINSTSYKLTEMYKILLQSDDDFLINYGTWNDENGLVVPNSNFYKLKSNFNNTQIIINGHDGNLIRDNKLYSHHEKVFHYLCEMTNSRYRKISIFNMVVMRLAYHMIGVTAFQKEQIGPIFKSRANLYIKYPKTTVSGFYFLLPFNLNMWLALASFIFVTTIIAVFVHICLSWKKAKKENTDLIEFVFMTLEIMCNQSSADSSSNFSVRMLSLTTSLVAVTLLSAYSASLSGYLLLHQPQLPFEDIDGAIRNTLYEIGTTTAGYVYFFMRNFRENKTFNIDMFKKFRTTEEGLLHACNDYYTIIELEYNVNYSLVNCALYKIQKEFQKSFTSIVFREQYAGIKDIFFHKWLTMYSSGIMQKLREEIKPVNLAQPPEEFIQVEFDHIFYLLFIAEGGMIFSLLLLALEWIWKNFTKNCLKHRKNSKDKNNVRLLRQEKFQMRRCFKSNIYDILFWNSKKKKNTREN